MKTIRGISIAIVVIIFGGWALLRTLTVHIRVGQVGVRIQQYGILGQKGIKPKDYGPGWHRDLGPVDDWQVYDATVQTLEMTRSPLAGDRLGSDEVKVQSADGNSISLDVTVKYRLAESMAHKIFQDTGSGTKYRIVVRNEAEKACMGLFGQMKTEDFYNPAARRKTAFEVKEALAASLENNYIEVIDVLIRDVVFNPEYERKIRTKKLADQEVQLNISEAKAEGMRGKTQVIEAETEKLVNIIIKEKEAQLITMQAEADLEIAQIKANADRYVTELQADADLVLSEKESEGERLVKEAEAEGERLRNEALAGSGGDVIAALEAARSLTLDQVTISTVQNDLLDLDAMATKLGVKEEKE